MKTYIVQFEQSSQITEDQWRVSRPSLEVDENTVLSDILKWAALINQHRLPEVLEIREIQKIKKP